MTEQHRVWVGAAGTGTAFGLIRSLRRQWNKTIYIVAADTNPPHLVAASQFADTFIQVPPTNDPGFVNELLEALERKSIDTYFPIFDTEIVIAAQLRDSGKLDRIPFIVAPGSRAAEICLDKLETAKWLTQHGFPSPLTLRPNEASWRTNGWFLKARRGVGSRGARQLTDASDLARLVEADPTGEEWVVQVPCELPEITLDSFYDDREDWGRTVCRERLEVKSGVCTKARVFEDAVLTELSLNIARSLGLSGVYCLQVMRNLEGEWQVTDVNPRPGAGTALSAAVGLDFFVAGATSAWGKTDRTFLPRLKQERFVVRQYNEYAF